MSRPPAAAVQPAAARRAAAQAAVRATAVRPAAVRQRRGDATKGATVYSTNCVSCHSADAAGKEGPNITMSMTAGIGSWTYQQFHDAVRLGKDKDGTQLCPFMTPFPETSTISRSGHGRTCTLTSSRSRSPTS